jgi:mRNA interferase RelE/StbE
VSAPGPYILQYDPKALKELTKIDKPAARRIVKAIDALSGDPRPSGARPLVGYPDLWRIRVGDYRVSTRSKTRNSWFSHCGSPIAARFIATSDNSGLPVPVLDSKQPTGRSLVTRLEFVGSSPRGAAQAEPHPKWLSPPLCPVDSTRACATDVPHALAPERSVAGTWALDLRRRDWGRSRSNHDRRIQIPDVPQMCHKRLLRDDF